MEDLHKHFNSLNIHEWKSKLDKDLAILSKHYAEELYDNVGFVPYDKFDHETKTVLIDYLSKNNHARTLLTEKIKTLYPNDFINTADVDSIMDYYIDALRLL